MGRCVLRCIGGRVLHSCSGSWRVSPRLEGLWRVFLGPDLVYGSGCRGLDARVHPGPARFGGSRLPGGSQLRGIPGGSQGAMGDRGPACAPTLVYTGPVPESSQLVDIKVVFVIREVLRRSLHYARPRVSLGGGGGPRTPRHRAVGMQRKRPAGRKSWSSWRTRLLAMSRIAHGPCEVLFRSIGCRTSEADVSRSCHFRGGGPVLGQGISSKSGNSGSVCFPMGRCYMSLDSCWRRSR